jgi:hypothetical protein
MPQDFESPTDATVDEYKNTGMVRLVWCKEYVNICMIGIFFLLYSLNRRVHQVLCMLDDSVIYRGCMK